MTSESVLVEITEQDLVDMKLLVGQKIFLRRVIACLTKSTSNTTVAPEVVLRVRKQKCGRSCGARYWRPSVRKIRPQFWQVRLPV